MVEASTVARVSGAERASPIAVVVPMTGMVTSGAPRVPATTPVRSGELPWLKTMTAEAPASWALSAFSPKVQVPRRIRAMLPVVNPTKSASSQPLVVVVHRGEGSTACTGVSTTASEPEYVMSA